jgi:hypothetical protein
MIMTNKRTTGGSGLRAFLAPGSGMEKIIKTRSKIREGKNISDLILEN